MPQLKELLVLLASPGDVSTERRYAEEVLYEVNRTVASRRGYVLQMKRWERDTFPGYGQDAQALINAQIAEMGKYSLFVGIMWNRLGTPTPRSASGTVEEFERAVEALARRKRPKIWFYFRNVPTRLDNEGQLKQQRKVLKFKRQVQNRGLPWAYKNPADFRAKFRNQLILWINTLPKWPPRKRNPRLLAEFELTRTGKPRVVQQSYSIRIYLASAPADTRRVVYELDDDSFYEPIREVERGTPEFEEYITSYGDFQIVATISGRRTTNLTKWLSDALYEHYRHEPPPAIDRAIDEIREN